MKPILLTLVFLLLVPCYTFTQVEVVKEGDRWELKVDGQNYEVKGATFGYTDEVGDYDKYFEELKFLGVNTIRLWATDKNTAELLDAAERSGIKVMVGIWMRHGRPGMEDDDSFDYLTDEEGKKAMYEVAIETVKAYKDHPAVLTWGIGNEVYLNMATDPEKKAYSLLLEEICSDIKLLDPAHPITSVEAWTFGMDWWSKYVPSIDIYGLNSYGAGAGFLQAELDKKGLDKPYIITEYGVTGEWDMGKDQNGVTIEPNDLQKYEAIASEYENRITSKPSNLGVFVFHYGDGEAFGSAWLLSKFKGKTRPAYWGIRKAYTGQDPLNYIPEIPEFTLPEKPVASGTWLPVKLEYSDQEEEQMTVQFLYNQRTGSRRRRDQILALEQRGNRESGFEILVPVLDGPVKIYAAVTDEFGNMGLATTSIQAIDKQAREVKYKVPKAELPFYVYQDNENLPYFASGYMGNYKDIRVDLNCTEEVYEGKTSIKIEYKSESDWYGVSFSDPANDWGDILGGYDISGAKTFSFWARTKEIEVKASVGYGLIGPDKPFPDTGKQAIDILIKPEWKKYTIKIKKSDLSCIRSGLVFFSRSTWAEQTIYIDNVVFE